MAYYNTNKETGQTLANSQKTTQRQEQTIYDHIKQHGGDFTRHELEQVFTNCPATSIARALKNLCDENKLEKTDKMRLGGWGKMVHTWKIKHVHVEADGQTAINFI